jgi:hypothetical protein
MNGHGFEQEGTERTEGLGSMEVEVGGDVSMNVRPSPSVSSVASCAELRGNKLLCGLSESLSFSSAVLQLRV